jgi:hypothetical protein
MFPRSERATGTWIDALRHGLDVLVAFATLRDTAPQSGPRSRQPSGPVHPHRHALRAPARSRRPGVVRPQPQPCLTPLASRRKPQRPGLAGRCARHA